MGVHIVIIDICNGADKLHFILNAKVFGRFLDGFPRVPRTDKLYAPLRTGVMQSWKMRAITPIGFSDKSDVRHIK